MPLSFTLKALSFCPQGLLLPSICPATGSDNQHKHPKISHTDAKILAPGSLMLTRNTETGFGGKKGRVALFFARQRGNRRPAPQELCPQKRQRFYILRKALRVFFFFFFLLQDFKTGTSLMVQWLRIHPPMQGTPV